MKNFNPFLIFTIVFLNQFSVLAQYKVTATVIDEEGQPEEYATYRIYELPDTTRQILGNVTKADGKIDSELPKPGDYKIVISAMMKNPVDIDFYVGSQEPVVNLGVITTELTGETLSEVTVTAQRPLVSKEIDRISYDVQADGDASTSNLREILKKVPLISVDEEGNIKVNGSDNFKIYRNGRPNNAFTKNAKDIFAAIPASTIKSIEVITDPGAREDAESSGVILNIVTTSVVSMSGITGNIGLNYQTNFGPQANAFIMTQLKKLTLSASGGFYSYLWRDNYSNEDYKVRYSDTEDELVSNSRYGIGNKGGWFNMEGSLEADSLNLFTTSLNCYINNNSCNINSEEALYDKEGFVVYSYLSDARYRKYGYKDIDFNLDYQRRTRLNGETLTLSYRLSHTRQDQDQTTDYTVITGNPFSYSSNISDFDLKFFEHTFQFDWTRHLGKKFILDTGTKYILRSSHSINHQTLVAVNQTFDDFRHTYNIFGIYADARVKLGVFSARAGVRYEYSRLQADFLTEDRSSFHSNLNDVVPNASMALNIRESSMWKLSYNRRIQRPGISYLNPAVSIYPNIVSYGNPDLESATIDYIGLNYSLSKSKLYLDLSLNYNISNNGIGSIQWTNSDNTTYATYDNRIHSRNLTFSAFCQWQITDKTSWMINGNLGWAKYSLYYEDQDAKLSRLNLYYYTRLQQKLPWELTLSLSSFYFSGNCNSVYSYSVNEASSIGYSIGLKRTFLKNKTLDVNISLDNIGIKNSEKKTYYLNSGKSGIKKDISNYNQRISFGINWRFGNLKASVKKTDKSISNDDLQGRKNN